LEEIADDLGMTKGSLYNYISSKEDLLEAVISPAAEELLATARDIVAMDLPASEKLRKLTRAHVLVIERIYDFTAVYLHEIAGRHLGQEWNVRDHEYVRTIESIIRDGVTEGVFKPDVQIHICSMTLVGALNWLTRWWNPEGPLSASDIADQISDTILTGLIRRSASTAHDNSDSAKGASTRVSEPMRTRARSGSLSKQSVASNSKE